MWGETKKVYSKRERESNSEYEILLRMVRRSTFTDMAIQLFHP